MTTSTSLRDRITDDMKSAMRAKETARLSAIRLLLAAIKQKEVDERITLDDAQVSAVIEKLLKQRKDSITQYDAAGRQDLADNERFEADLLSGYLPERMSAEEITVIVASAVASTGAQSPADMGKVMAAVKPQLAGRADMGEVSKIIKSQLAK